MSDAAQLGKDPVRSLQALGKPYVALLLGHRFEGGALETVL